MKRKVFLSSLAIVLAICLATSSLVMALDDHLIADTIIGSKEEKIYSTATLEDDFADNRVLVVLTNEASVSLQNYGLSDFSEINCNRVSNLTQSATDLVQAELRGEDPATLYSVDSGTVTFDSFFDVDEDSFNRVLCIELTETGKDKVLEAMDALMERDDILYAGPDYEITITSVTPNDALYTYQWAPRTIQLPLAWETTTGTAQVQVGVIDTGIDGEHPDLVNRLNVTSSRDFSNGIAEVLSEVVDPHGHGTHVAGIIAAQGNNSKGVAGTAWNVELISLRALSSSGSGFSSNVAEAIDYATRTGIPLLNLSAGWSGESVRYDFALSTTIQNYPGLFICAAANDNENSDAISDYPANYRLDNLISVGASDFYDTKAEYSNYGATTVDIFAPGDFILSCNPTLLCTGQCDESVHEAHGYHYRSGTSMATAFVTGVAALILSANRTYAPEQIKDRIMNSVDIVTDSYGNNIYGNLCVSGGRLNAYKAVHSHAYTYTSLNATKHTCNCSCGYSHTENHSWTTISTNDASTNATIRTCGKCGYSKPVLN